MPDVFPAPRFGTRNRYQILAVCGFLLLAVAMVFGQTIRYQFVNYDDTVYVCKNPHVAGGLTAQGIAWVFTHQHGGNWHPLTSLSHMLDCQLYGLNAGGHHLTNVLLHAATAILLFLVLWRMTGGFWPGAVVAALFAVHPLRVESVAWVFERKDVLSGLFFVFALGAYAGYVRHRFSLAKYLWVMVFFVLGLMAKPMLVTLPFVLLLLDYWPLSRMNSLAAEDSPVARGGQSGRFAFPMRLVFEKIPLLFLAGVFSAVTLWAQREASALEMQIRLGWRIANALVSYVAYLGQLFCPLGLAVLYPHPGPGLPVWKVVGAVAVLAGISAGALACWRRCPYLLVGWLWYLGMLAPVIGWVQVGGQAMADRYTYLPQIGLYIALAWALADVCRSSPYRRRLCATVSALVLVVLMGGAWRQTSFWSDSEALWTHALACTSQTSVAHNNLALVLADHGQTDSAIAHYQKALEIEPDYADAHYNLALVLADQGQIESAITHYRKALQIKPDYADAHNNLGNALAGCGQVDLAITHYQKALEIKPDCAEAHHNLAVALAGCGQVDLAITHYRKALQIKPDYADAHNNLGNALAGRGQVDLAIAHYQKALQIKPDYAEAHHNLGNALAGRGQVDLAIAHYRKALQIKPDYAEAHNNLGTALASRGQVDLAIAHYRKALQIKPDYAKAHHNLAVALSEREGILKTLAKRREAMRLQPNDAAILNDTAWMLATNPNASVRNGAEAIELAERALKLSGGNEPAILGTLAAAYAEAGRFPEAAAAARKALELALRQNKRALADVLRARIALYEAGKPYHEAPSVSLPALSKP